MQVLWVLCGCIYIYNVLICIQSNKHLYFLARETLIHHHPFIILKHQLKHSSSVTSTSTSTSIRPAYPRATRADSTFLEYYAASDVYLTAPRPEPLHALPSTDRNRPRRWPPAIQFIYIKVNDIY